MGFSWKQAKGRYMGLSIWVKAQVVIKSTTKLKLKTKQNKLSKTKKHVKQMNTIQVCHVLTKNKSRQVQMETLAKWNHAQISRLEA